MWLVYVEGKSGSGKSEVSKYLGSELPYQETGLGFARYSIDTEVRVHLAKPLGVELGNVYRAMRQANDYRKRFWSERGALHYNLDTAKRLLLRYADLLDRGGADGIPYEDAFHIAYAVWDHFLTLRDRSLQDVRNVVLDSLVDSRIRESNFFVNVILPHTVKRLLIRLYVDDEIAIQRKMKQHGWDRNKAERIVLRHRKFDYSPLLPPGMSDETIVEGEFHLDGIGAIPYVEYRMLDEDWPGVEEDLRKRFTPNKLGEISAGIA